MFTTEPFIYNGVTYKTNIYPDENIGVDFLIVNPKNPNKPDILYKYYEINKNSVDSFLNNYFYSSHPFELNDKYDCSGDLIDYSKLGVDFFIKRLSKDLRIFSEEKIRLVYNSLEKRQLFNALTDLDSIILYTKFGVISLTENYDNILMWSHYAKNSGFVLKFKTDLMSKDLIGPFPINYTDSLEKIDSSVYHFSICMLYQTNVKSKKWEYENEWRYITYNPNGNYHPFYSCTEPDVEARKFKYNPKSLDEVILGDRFFEINEIDFDKRTNEYDVINIKQNTALEDYKIKFLNHIVDNSIKCSQIVRNRDKFILNPIGAKIEKLTYNQFKIYNQFKNQLLI
jgi:hypothetical protein